MRYAYEPLALPGTCEAIAPNAFAHYRLVHCITHQIVLELAIASILVLILDELPDLQDETENDTGGEDHVRE